jgi:hypothetical protein
MYNETNVNMREDKRTLISEHDWQWCITSPHYDGEHERCIQPSRVGTVSEITKATKVRIFGS